MNKEKVLEVKDVTKKFGGLTALNKVNLDLQRGEILGLIGPNGAGKTTMFNVIAGAIKSDSGTIIFENQNIINKTPDQLCRLGIARTFQITKPFHNMDLLNNVTVGAYFGKKNKTLKEARESAEEILEFTRMKDLTHVNAKNLSIGNLKKLELARALATEPKILLLDEVIGGLTPTEANEVVEIIAKICDRGISIIMIEHVMKAVMSVSNRIVVLNHGQILAKGSPNEVVEDERVITAYLGGVKNA